MLGFRLRTRLATLGKDLAWEEGQFPMVPMDYGEALLKARIPDAQRGYRKDHGLVALTYPKSMGFVRLKNKSNPKQTE